MPKITVIVPVYNTEKYLDKCLTSIINQTLSDIEIICVDDCSTDNSPKILEQYANKDSRITVIHNKKNSGLSVSRNVGIKHSHSKYLMFCDADDYYEPNMCEDMLNLLITNNADLAVCSVNVFYDTDKKMGGGDKAFTLPDGCFKPNDEQLKNIHNGSPLRIFKKDIIEKYDIKYPAGMKYEDIYFNKVYNLYTKTIATTSKKLYNYRRSTSSITADIYLGKSNDAHHNLEVMILYFQYLKEHNFYKREYYKFWTEDFIAAAQYSLMFTKDKNASTKLDERLTDFISKNYVFGTTNEHTDYIMSLILDGTFMRRQKYLFGLFQVYREAVKTEYNLFNINIFKIKRKKEITEYYLFGIKIYKHRNLA